MISTFTDGTTDMTSPLYKVSVTAAAVWLAVSGLLTPVMAQEQSTEEQLKSISLICAGIYQVQIDTNAGTPDAATKRDSMKQVYVALSKVSEAEASQQIAGFTGPLKDIKTNDASKWGEYLNLCEELSKPSAS